MTDEFKNCFMTKTFSNFPSLFVEKRWKVRKRSKLIEIDYSPEFKNALILPILKGFFVVMIFPVGLQSISPTFYKQLLHQYFFAKKLQSQIVSREKLLVKCW